MLAAAAFAGGAINSVAGGGSFITFPALILTGVPPISANATNNAAMWVGVLGSSRGYKREIREYRRLLIPAAAVSFVGSILGAILLLHTPPSVFERLIPYLLLFATVVFTASPFLARPRPGEHARRHSPVQLFAQFAVSVYGGYFGAGIGILMLAILGFSGLPNLNVMNGMKAALSVVVNGVALIPFIIAGIVVWPTAVLMAVFALVGGYAGAKLFRHLPSNVTRTVVIVVGCTMTAYFFLKAAHAA